MIAWARRLIRPVDWERLPLASRIMLPIYPIAMLMVAAAFLLQSSRRTSGPAFDAASALMPIRLWALVFLALALAEVAGLLFDLGRLLVRCYGLQAGLSAFWATLITISALRVDLVSFSVVGWMLIVVCAPVASARSVQRDYLGS